MVALSRPISSPARRRVSLAIAEPVTYTLDLGRVPSMQFALSNALPLALLTLVTACCPNKADSVAPEPTDIREGIGDWVDEPLEVAKTHEVDAPPVDPYADLSEDERLAQAEVLFHEAEALAKAEQWAEAEAKYETAYHLVPGKHGFAYKVAMAAVNAGDCEKARLFLEHFIIYGDIDRQKPLILEARREHRKLEC